MAFVLECVKCKAHSPPIVTSVPPPSGWQANVSGDPAKQTTTSWSCPTCAKKET